MASQTIKLTVGGPVQANYGTYLSRPADDQLFKATQAGRFAYVLACRQIGKSSLMFETAEKLRRAGVSTALIDLNSIGQLAEADSWYFSLIDELTRKLGLNFEAESWWEARPRLSTLTHRFLQFLQEVVLAQISEPVVIFVDEIDMTLELDFTDDFFAAIRSVHNERAQSPPYRRLTFVLLGVATPDDLIKDPTRTPFNIGQAITLRDFTKQECEPFRLEIEHKYPAQGRLYFDQVYEWTGGHPYLTQKLCEAVLKAEIPVSADDQAGLVDKLVRRLFLAAEARGEDNIQFVQTRVTGDRYAPEMLKVYGRILEGASSVYDDEQSPAINRLKLYGLVVAQDGKLAVRNKLYAQAFDSAWTNEMLRLSSTGARLGLPERYKVLQEIGQGGFGTVYLAQLHKADKSHSVALKVLKTRALNDQNQIKRFKQEARAIARLEHPNIIRILETGDDKEPFFIAMEYVPGGTLQERLKSGPLSRPEAIHIIRQVGAALTYAHQHGVIHRDVNPKNILLDTAADPIRPILTDFGLIKILAGADFSQLSIDSSQVQGTLDYMAPEQWRQETPTPATDVYALAITFFEMLAGQRPFAAKSLMELMGKHTSQPLPHLSSVAPEVGPYFDAVLMRAAAKAPSDRFETMADFIAALEVANEQAEENERAEQLEEAVQAVELAQRYIQKGHYDPERALSMIELALEMYPGYLDALRLRGKIWLQQDRVEKALADYRQAYEQAPEPSSEVGLEYLELLGRLAGALWQGRRYQQAVKHYETIQEVLGGRVYEVDSIQKLWAEARGRLIEYHHYEGDLAYLSSQAENVEETISVLSRKIEALETLKAGSESEDLRQKLRLLQVKRYENLIKTTQAAIDEANLQESHLRFSSEDIFQHYAALDEAYEALIELVPEPGSWSAKRRKRLKERAQSRQLFAMRALSKLDPDYGTALRHYKAILDLEQAHYPGLAQELNLDLPATIAELEKKADHDGKYHEIRRLMESGDYLKALERLDNDFMGDRNYEHRDVAKMLWGLVYAKQHEGNLPPEWESMSGFEALSKRLVGMERARIQQLKGRLESWSQANILETIGGENKALGDYETQIKDIEILLNEAVIHGVTAMPHIETCRGELDGLKAQIQKQRDVFFQVEVKETAQKVELWLQKIEEIEALLQTGNPVKDIPEFLDRVDIEQQAIEQEPMFETVQALVAARVDIGRAIAQLKRGLRKQLVPILIEDVGRRDEELSRAREEVAKAQAELAGVKARESTMRREIEETGKQYRLFSASLIPALIVGGVIGVLVTMVMPEVQNLTWVIAAAVVTMLFWAGWVYWQSRA